MGEYVYIADTINTEMREKALFLSCKYLTSYYIKLIAMLICSIEKCNILLKQNPRHILFYDVQFDLPNR